MYHCSANKRVVEPEFLNVSPSRVYSSEDNDACNAGRDGHANDRLGPSVLRQKLRREILWGDASHVGICGGAKRLRVGNSSGT
jgi:hypothetical protein